MNNIAIYSPHTACDAAVNGVNDWLVRGIGDIVSSAPITPNTEDPRTGMGRIAEFSDPKPTIEEVIHRVKKHLQLENVQVAVSVGARIQHRQIVLSKLQFDHSQYVLVLETLCYRVYLRICISQVR